MSREGNLMLLANEGVGNCQMQWPCSGITRRSAWSKLQQTRIDGASHVPFYPPCDFQVEMDTIAHDFDSPKMYPSGSTARGLAAVQLDIMLVKHTHVKGGRK